MSALDVNDLVENYVTDDLEARPVSKGQYGVEYVLNTSINEVVCHGFPSQKDILRDGDIVNFDITLEKNEFIADSSKITRSPMHPSQNVSMPQIRLPVARFRAATHSTGQQRGNAGMHRGQLL